MKELLIGVGILIALFVIFSIIVIVAISWIHKW